MSRITQYFLTIFYIAALTVALVILLATEVLAGEIEMADRMIESKEVMLQLEPEEVEGARGAFSRFESDRKSKTQISTLSSNGIDDGFDYPTTAGKIKNFKIKGLYYYYIRVSWKLNSACDGYEVRIYDDRRSDEPICSAYFDAEELDGKGLACIDVSDDMEQLETYYVSIIGYNEERGIRTKETTKKRFVLPDEPETRVNLTFWEHNPYRIKWLGKHYYYATINYANYSSHKVTYSNRLKFNMTDETDRAMYSLKFRGASIKPGRSAIRRTKNLKHDYSDNYDYIWIDFKYMGGSWYHYWNND